MATYKYFTKALTCPDGTRKYIRAKTQQELDIKVALARSELENGVNINDRTTVSELIQSWMDIYKKPVLCERSYKELCGIVNTHIIPYIGYMRVRDVKPAHIANVVRNHGYQSKACNSALISYLRTIFNYAMDNGVVAKNPVPTMLKPTGADHEKEEPLTKEQASELLKRLRERNKSAYLFTLIALTTGMRRSEIFGLTWDCVDLRDRRITVRQQYIPELGTVVRRTKTPAGKRELPMSAELYAALAQEKMMQKNATFVVTNAHRQPVTPGNYHSFCEQWDAVYPEFEGHIHAHLFRHSYATWLVASGMDPKQVQYLLGHSDLKMTLGLYAHYQHEARREETREQVSNALGRLTAAG